MTVRLFAVTGPDFYRTQYYVSYGDPAEDEAKLAETYRETGEFTATLLATSPDGVEEWTSEAVHAWLEMVMPQTSDGGTG